ncbi:hypothetical protein, partial [Pseudomonas syringae]
GAQHQASITGWECGVHEALTFIWHDAFLADIRSLFSSASVRDWFLHGCPKFAKPMNLRRYSFAIILSTSAL